MSPLEKKDRRLGEGKRISKKKISTRTMIKKAVRGGKIDFHLRDYFPNGSSLITPHVTESGIWEKLACGIRNPGLWSPEYSPRNLVFHKQLELRIQVPLTKTGIDYL